jgi:hypothetical protein
MITNKANSCSDTDYEAICKFQKNVFEMIPDDKPVKFYFDCDHVFYKDFHLFSRVIANELLILHKYYLKIALKKMTNIEPIFAVAESHSEKRDKGGKIVWGYSFHIVVTNIIANKANIKKVATFINEQIVIDQEDAVDKYNEYTEMDIDEIFDLSVYKGGMQKFRCVYASKDGENRPFNLIEGTFEDMVISGFISENATLYDNTDKYVNAWNTKKIQDIDDIDDIDDDNVTKYQEYAHLIRGKQIAKYGDYYKFSRASANIGIPFDIFDKVVCAKKNDNYGVYDVDKNKEMYITPHNESKDKLGWRAIYMFANTGDEDGKLKLDAKYRAIQRKNSQDLIKRINQDLKDDEARNNPIQIIEQRKALENETESYKDTNWDLSEAEFAKQFKSVCFKDTPIVFTGKNKDPDGFMFNGIYWTELSLHNAELQKGHFDNLYVWYSDKLKMEKGKLNELVYKSLLTKLKTLNSYSTRVAVIKIFKADNYEENVEWDKNNDLFVFEDRIYSLLEDKFVKPNSNDYVSMSNGKKYNIGQIAVHGEKDEEEIKKEKDKNALEIAEKIKDAKVVLINFLKGIVPNSNYEFFLKQLSSFLKQENKEEKGYFWLGRGRNGKGTTTDLLSNALGNYWGELNMENYTNISKEVDKPNQNLYNCRRARVLNSSEVNDNDSSNKVTTFVSSFYKKMTGQDRIYARELGTKNTTNFIAGKTIVQTNLMPHFNVLDISLRQRIIINEFPTTFTDDEELIRQDPSKYKKKDITLKETFKKEEYRIALIDMLFEEYTKYKCGYIVPESVQKYTNSWFSSQSITSVIQEYCKYEEKNRIKLEDIQSKLLLIENRKISIKGLKTELEASDLIVSKIQGIYYLKNYVFDDEDKNKGEFDDINDDNTDVTENY